MSHGKCEPTNTNAADYKLYARFDAGETLESVLASPPTTKHNKVTSEGNIRTEHNVDGVEKASQTTLIISDD
ncbi:MAG: hypothetical protein ACLUQ2_13065 [Klebsiella pneumoniae]